MTTTTEPAPKKCRKPGTLYRIAGCLWAITALFAAISGDTSQTTLYLALAAMFLLLGRRKARQAQPPKDADSTTP